MLNRLRVVALLVCLLTSVSLFAASRTWTGDVNGLWSVAANWSPSGVPQPVDALIFQAGGQNRNMFNDLPPGTPFGAMTFSGDPYTLSGNLLLLTGDVNGCTCNVDLKLGASVAFSGVSNGAMDINGQTLTSQQATFNGPINGNGTIISAAMFSGGITLNGGNFSGTIHGGPTGGGLSLGETCSLPNTTIAIELIQQSSLSATLGDVTITPSQFGYVSPGPPGGVLHTKSLTLSAVTPPAQGGGVLAFLDSTGGDQIDVTGTVTLNGAPLGTFPFGNPAIGQSFTIIKNDGTDPVIGTFAGLPEGAILKAAHRFRVSYVGGDGNDVVLTTLAETNTALSQNANTTQFGEPFTVTATVTAQSGTPTGSAVFTADGVTIGVAPLQNGVANLTVTTLNTGTHAIVATFQGTGSFPDSVSDGITHVIIQGQTKTEIVSNHPSITYGQAVRFTAVVSAQSPALGQPAGNVTFLAGGVPLGTVPLVNGTAIFETSALHAGAVSITATYGGDLNFAASTASAIQQSVGKAQTQVDARTHTPISVGQSPLVTVFVNITPGSAIAPTGVVTVSGGGVILGTQVLAGGATSFSLTPLPMGDHTLVVDYSGGDDFEASSETIVQSVAAPVVSIHGVRVLEGSGGLTIISLVASLSVPTSETVRVSFSTVAGSATEGEDYEKASGVIEFAPGELAHAMELHIFSDTIPENDETFSVLFSDPVNATIDTPSAVIVIVNDDQIPPRRRPSRP
jgi:hypothetical protein